ncbi:hypothetical protein ABH15_13085 [Methanoculleus taiwanensis]|uniref:FHA domain-containing protein n=1 Tax=Methanoculleus taiwanensis TaxID=1550565 RepID=A0A498GW06_9EURY|nr:FHA domain-containing protein [Methanoculleus taiwanensis]RXE55149.1 hypothetical protein ABH15_13085 [Methanoculleus taiwanensis]
MGGRPLGGDEEGATIVLLEDTDSLQELSEYLDVLSSTTRLKILKLIEQKPKDIRRIASEIQSSYENTKKHMDKLLSIGVVRKEAGLSRETSRGIHPVWKYSLVPGTMEAIVRNLGLFSNMKLTVTDADLTVRLAAVRGKVSEELTNPSPTITLLGGPDDGMSFLLEGSRMPVGRGERGAPTAYVPGSAITLSEEYGAVTRISKPHAVFILRDRIWHLEDCGSTGGTFINGTALVPHRRYILKDGDLIECAKGVHGASFVFVGGTESGQGEERT